MCGKRLELEENGEDGSHLSARERWQEREGSLSDLGHYLDKTQRGGTPAMLCWDD